jgi:FKBP-type peptidyl-prolyl cis-trans isomerase
MRALTGCIVAIGLIACGEQTPPPAEAVPAPPLAFRFPVEEEIVPDLERHELADGLVVQCLEAGEGPRAGIGDRLVLHWRGSLAEEGTEVDSTFESGIPRRLTLGEKTVIPGLERGLLGTRRGSSHRIEIPAPLAYGSEGLGVIPPDAGLVYLVDVIRIE